VSEAVRAGGYRKSRAERVLQRCFKAFFQRRNRSIRICKILEICDTAEITPFFPERADLRLHLSCDRRDRPEIFRGAGKTGPAVCRCFRSENPGTGKITGARFRAE